MTKTAIFILFCLWNLLFRRRDIKANPGPNIPLRCIFLLLFYYFFNEVLSPKDNFIYDWCKIYPYFVWKKKIIDENVTTIQMSTELPHIYDYVHISKY